MSDKIIDSGVNLLNNIGMSYKHNDIVLEIILYSLIPVLIIVPYLIKRSFDYNDKILAIIAICFLLADTYMIFIRIYNKSDEEYLSTGISNLLCNKVDQKKIFNILYMLIPAYIFALYILGTGIQHSDIFLMIIGGIIFIIDNYHFIISY
ncbi:MAG: hypothetical protein Edafosvirus3_58 [Edafosvirus sp.]|uniref:Uncharacterized protein n=1 Tax=Edafosvirus sp. TaxID=2487765 RepID=A0A3G4ZSV4_9VIRU|nr:MAG: hypothetical protein Edafosvirus3_58 [Edafosvirus sp.]